MVIMWSSHSVWEVHVRIQCMSHLPVVSCVSTPPFTKAADLSAMDKTTRMRMGLQANVGHQGQSPPPLTVVEITEIRISAVGLYKAWPHLLLPR